MTSKELQTRIIEELWGDDALDARDIRVVVQGRDVWLEGTVPTPAMYDRAEYLVSRIVGVGDLTNALTTTDEPYDLAAHRDGQDLRVTAGTDVTPEGRLEIRIDPFGEEWDGATPLEGEAQGGPVGGDDGSPLRPTDLHEVAPLAADIIHAEEPWRYQRDGANAHIDPEPVLPPEEDEV